MKALQWYGADPFSITQVPSRVLDHIYEGHMDPASMLGHMPEKRVTPVKQARTRRYPDDPEEVVEAVYQEY